MIVVGGAYREICGRPQRDEMFGSGLRAATALTRLDRRTKLVSAVDTESELAARIVVKNFNLKADFIRRDEPVEFFYFTPISSPAVAGRNARLTSSIKVNGTNVLLFGMVERGEYAVDAESLIFDP